MTRITYTLLITAALTVYPFMAYADCGVMQPTDIDPKEPFSVHVCAHVVGTVCTPDSPIPECQDAAAVARLAEDDTVIVTPEK